MNIFFKASMIIIAAVVLTLSMPKGAKDFSVVMTIGICTYLIIAISHYLEPVVAAIHDLTETGGMDSSLLEILLKTTGVAVIMEFVILICNDSGNAAMGKGVQILGSVAILWLSLPLFTMLLDIVKNVLLNA